MNKILDKISDFILTPVSIRVEYKQLLKRISICRRCEHFYEDTNIIKCYKCGGCDSNLFFSKTSVCPLNKKKWQ